ncbi:phospholipase D-like domain-containing protein [Sphingobium chungbukense]|uniref:Phospholipase D-like domain-containing protein n=1 Tax=Sphingobium chungbukense TaxID=56193 RepID=A0A0M3AJK9_9SPHN|nr:hypothetical protein [Sphingobium chungbukense]KKW90257.1 hypothetical protein YP76_21320 [Sphingobium chungbukense]
MNPLDLISAAPWKRAAFTTYALSLSFFEAVLLDALLRGGGRNALILADPEGIRAGLSEEGARRVGRDYEIEPIACTNHGVFHAKIGALFTDDEAHLLVGSGNLTFAGWGGNLELAEHLHPSFAADAFEEAAGFFEQIAGSDQLVTSAGKACESIAESLRRATQGQARPGNIRLLHSLDGGIAEQLALYADDLGGVTRLTAISPYYDLRAEGLEALATLLDVDKADLHAHPAGTVRGQGSNAWPFEGGPRWKAVNVAEAFGHDDRPLHAKSIELVCRKGRLVLSGSANVTDAGLFGRNIEAGVLRIQRDGKSYWVTKKGTAPVRHATDELDETDVVSPTLGILSASLEGETIKGRTLAPRLTGEAMAFLRTPRSTHTLGSVRISEDGSFQLTAPGIEFESWESGRLILGFERGGKQWEGFVSISAALELIRRTGSIAPRLMAMLAGTETPTDVAAILAWFREDPSRLPASLTIGGGGESERSGVAEGLVTLADLRAAGLGASMERDAEAGETSSVWRHAMALIRASFTQARGPWGGGGETDDDDVEDEKDREKRARSEEAANHRSLQLFDELLTTMLAPEAEGRNALMALSLSHFLADRIRPAPQKVQLWLDKVLPQIASFDGPESDLAIASVLLHHAADRRAVGAIRARRYFLRRGVDPVSLSVVPTVIPAFAALLGSGIAPESFLLEVIGARTMGEQLDAYLKAAADRGPSTGFDSLTASQHWPTLERALTDRAAFAKLMVLDRFQAACPRCHMRLPLASAEDLRVRGVTSCCGRILINRDC